jgi:hypothetical protein
MTERKPARLTFESWIDRQIRVGMEQGDFDNLPGAGKPIADIDEVSDDLWWVKQKLKRENVSFLPASLVLRKEAEVAREAAAQADSEEDVRRIIAAINAKIREAIRIPPDGPPLNMVPFNIERLLTQWRSERLAVEQQPAVNSTAEHTMAGPSSTRQDRWWRRAFRRHRTQPG